MKKGLTEIVFILDRSGSMHGLEADTIGGFNSMMEKQKKDSGDDGEAYVSTVLFDDFSRVLHDRIPIENVPEMTDNDLMRLEVRFTISAISTSMQEKRMCLRRHCS